MDSADDDALVWLVVPVDELPCPQRLWKGACPLKEEHCRALDEVGERPGRHRLAFERFLAEGGSRMGECEYHEPEWHLAASVGVEVVQRGVPDGPDAGFAAAGLVRAQGGDSATARFASSFFEHPISVIAEGCALGNGQHRVCALKASAVSCCPVQMLRSQASNLGWRHS